MEDPVIKLPSPTATKFPFAYATAVNKPGVPEFAANQVLPSVEVRMLAFPMRSLPPTATKVSAPKVTPYNNASVPEFMVLQFNPSEERIRP